MTKLTRRQIIRRTAGTLFALSPIASAVAKTVRAPQFTAARIWPSHTYTRLTLESTAALKYQHFALDNPGRLVVDIQNANINTVLHGLSQKVMADDPFIRSIRAGQNTPTTVRLVIDLKQPTHAQVFALPPVGGFKDRLVVDLYPHGMDADDPMMALLNGSLNKTLRGSPEADPAQNTTPRPGRGKNGRRPVIMLDPGHGGEDPGAVSPGGLQEKHVVLSIARETKKQLEALGYNVFMTRNEDVFIPLGVRVAKGRARRADVFVSIHADAFTSPSARGTGVYMLNTKGATSSAAKFLEQTQNNADAVGGVPTSGNRNVDTALLDMTQTATLRDSRKLGKLRDSRKLGKLVLEELGRLNHLHKGRVDEANFAVLRAPDMPSILVETAFLSNPAEEKLLGSESFRRQCAQSIASGVQRYINTSVLKRG
ncbi:N-acetylmuramoyl-L-alanine amidase [Neisseria gonorrhoeae]